MTAWAGAAGWATETQRGDDGATYVSFAPTRRRAAPAPRRRPKVAHLEWLAPPMGTGHWIPELIEAAGCDAVCGKKGGATPVVHDLSLLSEADCILLAPCVAPGGTRRGRGVAAVESRGCVVSDRPALGAARRAATVPRALQTAAAHLVRTGGFSILRTASELAATGFLERSDWLALPAVRAGNVFVADGNYFFNRSSPRVVESAEIIAEAAHDDCLGAFGHHGANLVRLDELDAFAAAASAAADASKDARGTASHERFLDESSGATAATTAAAAPSEPIAYPTPEAVAAAQCGADAATAARAFVAAQVECLRGDSAAASFAGTRAAYARPG